MCDVRDYFEAWFDVDVTGYGVYTPLPIKSNITWMGHRWDLEVPTLNISFQYDEYAPIDRWFAPGNISMTGEWIGGTNHTSCLPSDSYQWGFSSLMLLSFCIATILFVCIVAALRRSNERHSRAMRYKQHFSVYRDALDVSLALRSLGDQDVEEMSAKDLDEYIGQRKPSLRLDIDDLLPSRSERKAFGRNRGVTSVRSGLQFLKRAGDSLPSFKKTPIVQEEEIALRSTPSTRSVFEGTYRRDPDRFGDDGSCRQLEAETAP